jgi:hypothetical protein
MNILQSQQQQSQTTSQRCLYGGKPLASLAIASAVASLLIIGASVFPGASASLSSMGFTLYLLVIAAILVVDWRGFLTMNGLLQWRSMTGLRRLLTGCLFIALSIFVVGFYLLQAYQTYRSYRKAEPSRRRRKIAEQEAELGMIPGTEGSCQKCHQPLQLGAEFCAYCGERVTDRPRICPECSTTTLPDARWCPMCGAQLDITIASLRMKP